ncbi:MAG: hypothetical protein IJI97_09390 [Clostridia bacterium]|nr:hypothetical protein [Clostridia bacterium]
MGTYTKSSINRTARPRSERLRELGGLIVPVSAAAASGGAAIVPTGTDHTHANLADLNRISITDGYIYITDEVIDPDTQETSIVTDKAMAGYADRAGANADGYTLDWFIPVTVNGSLTLKLNPIYAGLWAEGWISAGGVGSGGGGGGGSTVSVTQILTSGTSIATISVDGVATTIYAPSGGGTQVSWGTASGYVIPLTVGGTTKNLLLSSALTGYATESWVTSQGYLTSYTEQYRGTVTSVTLSSGTGITVSNSGTAITSSGSRTISISSTYQTYISHGETAYGWGDHAQAGYLTQHQSLAGYATESWVQSQGYLTQHQSLTGYATESWVQQQGYATAAWVGEQGYLTALGYIGTTQVQASSAKQALAGITQIGLISSSGSTPAGTLKPITIGSSSIVPKYGLRWTYQYLDQSSINPTLTTVNKTIAFTDDIPTPKKLYFGSTSGTYYDTTAQKVLTASQIGGVDLTSDQTIAGVKTFSDGIIGGDVTLPQNKHIDIGPLRIEYDDTNKALHITKADSNDTNTYGLYADGFITAGAANPNV